MRVKIDLQNDNSYEIYIQKLQALNLDRKVVLVTNSTIANIHLDYLKSKLTVKELHICVLKDGEEYKNFDSIQEILKTCFEAKLDRKSLLIAFGGGVIGDMTGFAASIYQRGIDFIQIPTTLLSQVDASVGGKTGINNSYGKNLIGTFHQPKAVYIDSSFLETLPKREFGAGIAEVIKMAVCFNKEFFTWIENNDLKDKKNIDIAIEKSVQTKAYVVSQDEKEQGLRAALNYGHTFGHVIENLTNYKRYLHGEAVGIGICMANALSVKLGYMSKEDEKRVENLLKKYDIPTSYKIENVDDFYEHFFLDKKSSNSKIKFILALGIGDCKIIDGIEKELVCQVLREFK